MDTIYGNITKTLKEGSLTKSIREGSISKSVIESNFYEGKLTEGGGPVYCSEFQAVYNSWTTKPSDTVAGYYNTMVETIVDGDIWIKGEFFDFFSTHTNDASEGLVNWINPGTFNSSLLNNPTFTAYQGFLNNSTTTSRIDLNFNPSTNGIGISQNNICVIMGLGTDLDEVSYDLYSGATYIIRLRSRSANNTRSYINSSGYGTNANTNSIKHYAISRGNSANYDLYFNLTKATNTLVSTGLCNVSLYTGGNKQTRYVSLWSYLTEAEITIVINAIETCLDSLGTGLI